jgi:hypothetical protein
MHHRQRAVGAVIVFACLATMSGATIAARESQHGRGGSGAGPASKGHGHHDCETREPHGNGQGNAGSTHGHSADDCAPPQFGGNEPGTDTLPPDISSYVPLNSENVVTGDDQQGPAQVPEPASLMLVSGGLIAGVRAYRKRCSGRH